MSEWLEAWTPWLAVLVALACSLLLDPSHGRVAKLRGVLLFHGGFLAGTLVFKPDALSTIAGNWRSLIVCVALFAIAYMLSRYADRIAT